MLSMLKRSNHSRGGIYRPGSALVHAEESGWDDGQNAALREKMQLCVGQRCIFIGKVIATLQIARQRCILTKFTPNSLTSFDRPPSRHETQRSLVPPIIGSGIQWGHWFVGWGLDMYFGLYDATLHVLTQRFIFNGTQRCKIADSPAGHSCICCWPGALTICTRHDD